MQIHSLAHHIRLVKSHSNAFERGDILTAFNFQANSSLPSLEDLTEAHENINETMLAAIHGDLNAMAFEPAFADGVDLTSFFAAEMRGLFDASAMDLFSEQ